MGKKALFMDKSNRGVYNKSKPKRVSMSITDDSGEVIVVRKDIDILSAQKELQRMVSVNDNNIFGSMNKSSKDIFRRNYE